MRRLLPILALTIAMIAAAGAPARAQISLLGLKNSLVQFALEQISTPDEFEITAEGVEEPQDGVTDLVGVAIADAQGVWLTAERLSLRWNASAILGGELEINELAIVGLKVLRQPNPADVAMEVKPGSELDQSDGDPFDWPRSPISLLVEDLRFERAFIAEGVLSPQSVSFSANGQARDQGDEQAVSLTLNRTDEIDGRIALNYLRNFAQDTLRMKLSAHEQAGGLVAALAGLPEDSASRLTIDADGPLSEWAMRLEAEAERVFQADGHATVSNVDRLSVDADFKVTPGEALSPELQRALSPEARLTARIAEGQDGVVRIEEGSLSAADLDLRVSGTYAKPTAAQASDRMDFQVVAEARSGLADLVDGVAFQTVGFQGAVTGPTDGFEADGAMTLTGLQTAPADVGNARLDTRISMAGGRIAFEVNGDASSLRLDKLDPQTVGPAQLSITGAYAEEHLALDGFSLTSDLLRAQASGALDLGASTASLDYQLSAPNLAPIARAYDADLAGAFSLAGQLDGPLDALRLDGQAALEDLVVNGEGFGRVDLTHDAIFDEAPHGSVEATASGSRYGEAKIATDFRLSDGTLALTDTTAQALGARLSGAAKVLTEAGLIDGAFDLSAPDLSSLEPALGAKAGGSAEGRITLAAVNGAESVGLDLSLRNFQTAGLGLGRLTVKANIADAFGDTPRVKANAESAGLDLGDARIDSASVNASGPLSAIAISLSAQGAAAGKPIEAKAAAQVNAAGAALTATVSSAEVVYDEERFSLTEPLSVRSENGATRFSNLALKLPGGAMTGQAALYPNGMSGDLALVMEDMGVIRRLGGAPIDKGRLEVEAKFDTRPGRATASVRVTATGCGFADAYSEEGGFDLNATLAWDGRTARAEAELSGSFGKPMTASVTLPLRPTGGPLPAVPAGGQIDGSASWDGDIGDLWALAPAPDHVLDGRLSFDMTVSGPIDGPSVSGDLSLRNGRYENLEIGTILTDLTAASRIEADGGFAVDVNAQDGSGNPVTGKAMIQGGRIDATVSSTRAVLVRRDDLTAEVSTDIKVSGKLVSPRVTGSVVFDRAEARLVSSGAPTVPTLGEVRIKGEPERERESEAGSKVFLDLTVSAPGDFFIRGRGLDSEWRMDLRVDGTAANPRVTGTIEKIRGQLSFLGEAFDLETGLIRFTGATPVDPSLDVALTRSNDGITGGIAVGGTANAPDISFVSTPEIPEEDVMPRLLFGQSKQSLSAAEALQLAQGLATLFDGGAGILDRIRETAGVDVLRVDEQDGATAVTVGQDVTKDVFVGVKQPVDGSAGKVTVEVDVFENITVDSEVGAGSGSSLGLNWKKDF